MRWYLSCSVVVDSISSPFTSVCFELDLFYSLSRYYLLIKYLMGQVMIDNQSRALMRSKFNEFG